MVLQQEKPANVWGWAAPGEKITVKLGGKTATTAADADGKWAIKLSELKPGAAGEMTITGKNTLTVKDVAVGEVWVCSGQSNMEFKVAGTLNAKEEIAAADFRSSGCSRSSEPQEQPQQDCSAKRVSALLAPRPALAVAYFFGVNLISLPCVGLIHTLGRTPAEFWTPEDVLRRIDFCHPRRRRSCRITLKPNRTTKKHWPTGNRHRVLADVGLPKAIASVTLTRAPGCPYNGMIAVRLIYSGRFAIRGVERETGEAFSEVYDDHERRAMGCRSVPFRATCKLQRAGRPTDRAA
jgi:sialate O-acetylesterase